MIDVDYNGLSIEEANNLFESQDIPWNLRPAECAFCGKVFPRDDMLFTRDCHGVPFHIACYPCYEVAMKKGYDGEKYEEDF